MSSARCVWIEPGCVHCRWCHHLMPTVFGLIDGGSTITATARCDGRSGGNAGERSPLPQGLLDDASDSFLDFVADGCPVQVIRIER